MKTNKSINLIRFKIKVNQTGILNEYDVCHIMNAKFDFKYPFRFQYESHGRTDEELVNNSCIFFVYKSSCNKDFEEIKSELCRLFSTDSLSLNDALCYIKGYFEINTFENISLKVKELSDDELKGLSQLCCIVK